ncbi:MAG TPA: amino acid ABC transporter substrate-binding protein [Usitatibacter sp.]|jgi:glutamate/aspartate transport system substrate-binding protein|nr:amino acid ABC transporter substrate-binding protein [Usitatibacter sp.]
MVARTVLAAAWLAWAGLALAQSDEPPLQLTGTLLKARTTGAVTIAHRESSIPFSYLSGKGEPIGYSIELCRKVVDAMQEAVGRELEIKWLAVTSDSRMDAIVSGRADLECGSTTSNLDRAKRVAFSPTVFVSGTKLMVKRGSPIHSFRDLAGKTVVVTGGTTNEQAMRELARKFAIDMKIVVSRDHAESFAEVASGKADAFATDDVLLYGLIASRGEREKYEVVGEFLSYDPYGVMFRKGDTQLAHLVNDTFRELADDGEIERQYKRWFLKRLPSGASIDLPMSPQLETLVRAMAARPE